MRLLITCTWLIIGLHCSDSRWLKKYEENYHRPTYRNGRHSHLNHVNYDRKALEDRDNPPPLQTRVERPFNASTDFTYYVNVLSEGSVICAGALISHRMVITSTHCFQAPGHDASYEFTAKHMSILTGIEFSPEPIPHQVLAFFMPVNRRDEFTNYVALLALSNKLDRHRFRYIPLNRKIPKEGDVVKMAFITSPQYEVTLYDTRVLNYFRCRVYYALKEFFHVSTFEHGFFCVRNRRHTKKTTCFTRPGDPLVVDNKLAGINIYGGHCDEEDDSVNMDIYLPIRLVIPFIQMATDALRAFTGSGPFNESIPANFPPMLQSLADKSPNVYVGSHVPYIPFDDPRNGGPQVNELEYSQNY
ncbi:kallikrein 1-related peptidase b21 [Drosophila rhopaloa]|uniref:Kallikrein 1-related peptidase b21 n=1 Tax=Drosophila rhopaloa TaxID=1041015 RepID=A0A6P4F9M1_DRORH|nr:kallikrein 1-related peptidase b21 [Drosophila rhopaloa]